MSDRWSVRRPRACSGDMYAAVPTTGPRDTPSRVIVAVASADESGSISLRQAEIEDLDAAFFRDEQIVGLDVPVNDAALVPGGKPAGNLDRVFDRPSGCERAAVHLLAQRVPFEQLRDDERDALMNARVMDRDDIRVIQAGGGARLPFEAPLPIRVARERRRQHLDRHLPVQVWIPRPIHLAHRAGAERTENLEPTESISYRPARGRPAP